MVPQPLVPVLREIRRLAAGRGGAASDGELLARFAACRDEAAFAALVERYGGLVLSVCRRLLPSREDAEDVCQAAFLVLARRAADVRHAGSLAAWLHGTAYRLAANRRRDNARRRRREQPLCAEPPAAAADQPGELRGVVDAELQRLPSRLRQPLLLCYLEGKTRQEAAACLGWSDGTLRGRLERGRRILRERLTRRGLTLAAPLLAALLADNVSAAAPAAQLLGSLTPAAAAFAAGLTPAAANPAAVALAEGMVQAMYTAKIKLVLAAALAGLLLLGGGLLIAGAGRPEPQPAQPEKPAAAAQPPEVKDRAVLAPVARSGRGGDADAGWREWQVATGLDVQGAPVFSPDGSVIALSDRNDSRIRFWDAATGKERPALTVNIKFRIYSPVLSAGGDTVAVCGMTRPGYFLSDRLQVIDVRSGEELLDVNTEARHIALSADGRRLAWTDGANHEYSLWLWDRSSGQKQRLPKLDGWSSVLTFSADGKTLAAAVGGKVRLFDTATGQERAALDARVYADVLRFSPDGATLAAGGMDWKSVEERDTALPNVVMLDVKTGKVLTKHTGTIGTANRGGQLLSGSGDAALWALSNTSAGGVIVWNVVTGREEVLLREQPRCLAALAPDGKTLAVLRPGGDGKTVLSLLRRGGS